MAGKRRDLGRHHDEPETPDPFAEWREIQDHQYDPGYWVGGRIHPLLRKTRPGGGPNKYGWVLLTTGAVMVAAGVRNLVEDGLVHSLWSLSVGIVLTAAGVRMLRGDRSVNQGRID